MEQTKLPIKTKIAAIFMVIIGLASLLPSLFLGGLAAMPIYSELSNCAYVSFFNAFLFFVAALPILDTLSFKKRRIVWWFSLIIISISAIISIIFCPFILILIFIPLILLLLDRKNFFKIAS